MDAPDAFKDERVFAGHPRIKQSSVAGILEPVRIPVSHFPGSTLLPTALGIQATVAIRVGTGSDRLRQTTNCWMVRVPSRQTEQCTRRVTHTKRLSGRERPDCATRVEQVGPLL